jgi:membrane fusion protein (multidrug efflux system)
VTVSTDLAGIVSQIAFESGATVKKGDLLLKLDTRQEEAQLRSAEARRDLASTNLDRQRVLIAKKAVAQSDYDSAESEFRQADAAVEDAMALIARKTILAPFDGLLGIRQANIGEYLNVGAPIVPLQSLDPIYVQFALPQQHLDKVGAGRKLRLSASGLNGEEFNGAISAIDSLVDETTRNILIQGTVANPGGRLVNVEVLLPETAGVVAIPASSISYAPYGDSVFIVKDKTGPDGQSRKVVEERIVKLGPSRGDQVSILSGVKEGDQVVTSGVFKLQNDGPVQISTGVQPGNDLTPNVPDT